MNDERNLGEKTDDSGQQPRYEHYQFHEEQRTVLKPSGPSGHRRNQNSFQKKAGATIALAVIFGLVAAVVFQAANFAADRFLNTGKSSVQIKTTDSVDLQETASDDSTADKVLSDSENGTVAAVAQASMPSVVRSLLSVFRKYQAFSDIVPTNIRVRQQVQGLSLEIMMMSF